jgi:MATE family multidrug resistance protein
MFTQAVSSLTMALFPLAIANIYTDDHGVAAMAAQLLLLAAIFQFSDGIQVTANGALRGLKDTTVPMAVTALAYWGIGMPVGWWLAFHAGFGARGMWMGLIAGLTVRRAVLLFTAVFARTARTRHDCWRVPARARQVRWKSGSEKGGSQAEESTVSSSACLSACGTRGTARAPVFNAIFMFL